MWSADFAPRTIAGRRSRCSKRWTIPAARFDRIILPPSTYAQERGKIEQRWPAAVKFISERKLNEFFGGRRACDVGIVLQGGLYNTVLRALERLGLRRRVRRIARFRCTC